MALFGDLNTGHAPQIPIETVVSQLFIYYFIHHHFYLFLIFLCHSTSFQKIKLDQGFKNTKHNFQNLVLLVILAKTSNLINEFHQFNKIFWF